MIHRIPFFAKRGMVRLLILEALAKGPAHGYEIIKRIESKFMGVYSPSPGIIYPNLQYLEEGGYLESREDDGRKVYTITEKGTEYLKEKRYALTNFLETKMKLFPKQKADIIKIGRDIIHDIAFSLKDMDEEQASRIAEILRRTRTEIRNILVEGGR